MIKGFYAAKSGARSFQTNLDVTANNIANVNTPNFKARRVVFSQLMQTMSSGSEIPVGSGAQVSASFSDPGAARFDTGAPLDASVSGEGFFSVMNPDGQVSFARSGQLSLSQENGRSFLVTSSGSYVLNTGGGRIAAQGALTKPVFESVALYRFEDPGTLLARGDGTYIPSAASGPPAPDRESSVRAGTLESANVDITTEMASMITAQRAFQYNLRMLQTADELERDINGLRN